MKTIQETISISREGLINWSWSASNVGLGLSLGNEQARRLARLQQALNKVLNLPSGMTVPIDGDGGIQVKPYKITGGMLSQKKKRPK
jgi:hypothetical protein